MKIREKRYLFQGFLNVLIVSLIALLIGFFMGTFVGVLTGVAQTAEHMVEICLKYPEVAAIECPFLKPQ